jgi:hypothetical protein
LSQEVPPELQAVYAAPQTEPQKARAALNQNARESGYRARVPLVRILTGVLVVEALLQGLNAACAILLSGWLTRAQSDALSASSHAVSTAFLPIYLFGLTPFAWFLVGSNKNARAFVRAALGAPAGEDDLQYAKRVLTRAPAVLRFTPASMVWSLLIPVINLVQPYQAVKAIWNASRPERVSGQVESAGVILQWWLSYLLALLVTRPIDALGSKRVGVVNHNLFAAFSNLVCVAASLLALRMVLALHERQSERAAELWPSDPKAQL